MFASYLIILKFILLLQSKHLAVFIGTGISTSCDIPNFRSPKGIWTLQHEGKALPKASFPFQRAMPSMTHMASVELEKIGLLKIVIYQIKMHLIVMVVIFDLPILVYMCLKLHLRENILLLYMRDFEVERIGLKETSRRCSSREELGDTVLDWEEISAA
ncbi:hypothetical protein Nepgr_032609 [Nepenthes gracilis]|uniref:protein acetyllysine N-acetyltransferase n=1 Tax=Nepenthes gracilis TaxID=150966 RepID=A0AAD3Y8F3_NEPGR|nr:hypothetical protein Nepgr_032609 [Nepenthes gracilis]